MKKRYILIMAMIVLIIIAGISWISYYIITESEKNYEIEQVKQYNYFLLKQKDTYGIIDKKGNTIIPAQYSEIKIPNPEKGVFICYQGEITKVLNERKEEILTQYERVEPIRLKNIASDLMYEKSILKYQQAGKFGLVSLEGKEITKPIYEEIDSLPYKEGELLVKQNGKYGLINIKGKILIEIEYDKIAVDEYYTDENRYEYAGYIVSNTTKEGYRYGYLNHREKTVLETEFNEISRVTEIHENENNYLICAKNGQYGIYKNGEEIVTNQYQSIRYDATNHVFVIEKSKKYGIANLEGKLIVPVQYNQIDITGIYLYAQNEQGVTVYNSNGTQANIDSNVSILNTSNEKYKIRINNEEGTKYGVINKEGKQLIEEKYNYIEYLYDNYFIVSSENGKLGIVDDKENEKISIQKDAIQKIQETELLQVSITENKITELYNKNMDKICEMKNAMIEVNEKYIKVYNEMEVKYFSKEGRELKNTEVYPNNKLFVTQKDGKYGYQDVNGNLVVNNQYDKAYEFNDYGFASVQKEGKWGAINEQGEEVVIPTYEMEEQVEPFFIGKYYRITYGFGEFYYTDDI